MAIVKPFRGYRPAKDLAERIAALPYDVYNRQEAKAEVEREPLSFLKIDRAETQFPDEVSTYADCVYEKARETLQDMIKKGQFVQDEEACFYIYELTMDGRSQTGIVGCASIDDYLDGTIKKHENTRAEKEKDRIRHVDVTNMQTGPIFLAYHEDETINGIIAAVKEKDAVADFVSPDGIRHRVWVVERDDRVRALAAAFNAIPALYIADGHHRCASAVKVGCKRREEHPGYNGSEEFNYFLSVLFADSELKIMDYNRLILDMNGLDKEGILAAIAEKCDVEGPLKEAVRPAHKGEFGMYIGEDWFRLTLHEELRPDDPVEGLDVAVLQKEIIAPIFGIQDLKTDKRIDYVGGIRGLEELERRVHTDAKLAFSMYPTDIQELFTVADCHRLMPPKSTWFEPKLRSGLFLHELG